MKKKSFVILILFSLLGNAQPNKIDSLKKVLQMDIEDTTRIRIMAELGQKYLYSGGDTAFVILQQGIALSRKLGYKPGEARCLSLLGGILWANGNYPKSLEILLQALKIYESFGARKEMGTVLLNIGNVYSLQGDEKQAIAYTKKCMELYESLNKLDLLGAPLNNLADSYMNINKLDSALIYLNKALDHYSGYNKEEGEAIVWATLGSVYAKLLSTPIAMNYYHKCISWCELKKNTYILCNSTLGMAELFLKTGQPDSAVYYSHISLQTAVKGGFPNEILKVSTFLTSYYKSKRMIDSAFFYQQEAIVAKDSLFSQEKVKAVLNLSFQEQIRQQEIYEANKLAEFQRKSNIQMVGIGTFISFFFGFLFLFSKRKISQKIIKFLGLLGILLLFEFISMFLSPFISTWTDNIPIFMLLLLVGVATVLIPIHHKLENWVFEKLAKRILYTSESEVI